MQKLEAFVESNPDLDGKDLRLAITELSMSLGDNHLSVKTMQNRQLVLEHVNNRLDDEGATPHGNFKQVILRKSLKEDIPENP